MLLREIEGVLLQFISDMIWIIQFIVWRYDMNYTSNFLILNYGYIVNIDSSET
jgi:hypothetical protein